MLNYQTMEQEPSSPAVKVKPARSVNLWTPIKRFVAFQIKLYVDAFRDLLLSALSFFAFVIDLLFQQHGEDSYFEKVLALGRRTERVINLFEQHDPASQGKDSIDGMLRDVEEKLRR